MPFSGGASEDTTSNDNVMSNVRLAKKYADTARSSSFAGGPSMLKIDPDEYNDIDNLIQEETRALRKKPTDGQN